MGHFYPRQTIVVPVGLVTEPNEYGQYPPGALLDALNVVMRAPGKLLQAPSLRDSVTVGAAFNEIHKLVPADNGVVYALAVDVDIWSIYADGVPVEFWAGGGPQTAFSNMFSATGRICWAQCSERIILNSTEGCLVRDPEPISTEFRAMGLPQPSIVSLGFSTTKPTWLIEDQTVGYRACLVRRYGGEDGDYTLRSVPSPAVRIHSQIVGANDSVDIAIKWPADSGLEPGDIIELYRTNILETDSRFADPGGTFKLVQEYVLTAADLAAPPPAGLVLTDTQAPLEDTIVTAGRELYTNPGVEGENYANLRPPICKCLVSFKGFCFYGHTTERAKFDIKVPGGIGPLGVPAGGSWLRGVGGRAGTGLSAIGSAVITGVPASEIAGVRVGMLWAGSGAFPDTATVIAVGATTITMSAVATAVDPSWSLDDVISINGVSYRFGGNGFLDLLDDLDGLMEAHVSQTMPHVLEFGATGFEMSLLWNRYPFNGPIALRATHGENYSPPLPEFVAIPLIDKYIEPITKKNRLCWSKEQQPEHAPSVSENFIGFGEMYALNATRDAVWIWCSDGLYRLSGNGGAMGFGTWQVDYANATLLLCAPQASTVLDDKLYGYCNEGVVELDSAGNVKNLTAGIIGNLLPGQRYIEQVNVILERNETEGELIVAPRSDGFTGQLLIHHVKQRGWTGFRASQTSAIGFHRVPASVIVRPRVLLATYRVSSPPTYAGWDAPDSFDDGRVQYQPVYGSDPLELKRWMWADYLFDKFSSEPIGVIWNDMFTLGPITPQRFDVGTYARAGVPREVGLSHSLSPGFAWPVTTQQQCFEGLSLAIKQRTNQSKQR